MERKWDTWRPEPNWTGQRFLKSIIPGLFRENRDEWDSKSDGPAHSAITILPEIWYTDILVLHILYTCNVAVR
jgi:hypothetical protein